jgi:hypothetical protein
MQSEENIVIYRGAAIMLAITPNHPDGEGQLHFLLHYQ